MHIELANEREVKIKGQVYYEYDLLMDDEAELVLTNISKDTGQDFNQIINNALRIMVNKEIAEKNEIDEFHFHEAMDRLYVVGSIIDDALLNHPVCANYSEVEKRVKMAQELLVEAYQYVGNVEHDALHEIYVSPKDKESNTNEEN